MISKFKLASILSIIKNHIFKTILGLFCIVLIYSLVFAKADSIEPISKKEIAVMLDNYATIAGGWYLNEKCDYLSPELKKEFEQYVSNCTVKMNKKIKNDFDLLKSLQRAGKNTADNQKYSCTSKETNDLVVNIFIMAKKLSLKLD
jgi:hypothetical protein